MVVQCLKILGIVLPCLVVSGNVIHCLIVLGIVVPCLISYIACNIYIYLLTLLPHPTSRQVGPHSLLRLPPWASVHCCSSAATPTRSSHRSHTFSVVLIFWHEKRCDVVGA